MSTYHINRYRISLVRDGAALSSPIKQFRSSRDAAEILRQYCGTDLDREHFVVALLDQKNVVIGLHTVAVGSLTAAVVHPREVFKAAILGNAAAMICCHNHPSGNPEPSREDTTLTHRLHEAGTLLGIQVLDHIILGDGTENYYSFADQGTLKRP